MADPVLGITIAALVDIVAPVSVVVPVVLANRRHRRTGLTDGRFWFWFGMYLLLVAILIGFAIADVLAYRGWGVVIAVAGALPFGLVPAIANSTLIAPYFSLADWTHFGYLSVLLIFVVGLLPWAAVGPLLLRRILQLIRRHLPREGDSRSS